MPIADPRRILVIKLRHHGDVLLATPVADALKSRYPDCEIDMLVYGETADMLRDNPQIAEIFTVDRSWKKAGLASQLREEKNLLGRLRARRYDWAFNLSGQWRAGFIAKLCATCSASLEYKNRDNFGWKLLHDFISPEPDVSHHIVQTNLQVVSPLLPPSVLENARVRMGVGEAAREGLRQKLGQEGWSGEAYVLVHPGARWFFKCWEDGKYAALVQLLLNHGHHVVLTGSPSQEERQMLDEIKGRLNVPGSVKIWDLGGKLNLRELAAAIEGADLFVGVDSVPMHMAAALDIPQVALFGASWVSRWRPYSDKAEVVWAGDFGELPHPDSIDTGMQTRLLDAIPLEAVWEKVSAKLDSVRG